MEGWGQWGPGVILGTQYAARSRARVASGLLVWWFEQLHAEGSEVLSGIFGIFDR